MATDVPAAEKAPAPPRSRWANRILLVLVVVVLVPLGATLVYHFPPAEYRFYPPCFFHALTGLHCPGCGATRCVGALARGDLEQAFAYNSLFVLLLPVIVLYGLRVAYEMWTGKKAPAYPLPKWTAYVVLGVIIAYFVARNIPVYPFGLLAPHELILQR